MIISIEVLPVLESSSHLKTNIVGIKNIVNNTSNSISTINSTSTVS